MNDEEREELLTILRSLAVWMQLAWTRLGAIEQLLKRKYRISDYEWKRILRENHVEDPNGAVLEQFLRDAPRQ